MKDSINCERIKREAYLALLKAGHCLSMPAKGWSMHPAINDGDVITIERAVPLCLRVGEIIAYKKEGESNTIVHRLMRKYRRNGRIYFVTKGDAVHNYSCDQVVAEEDILGRVINRERNGKTTYFKNSRSIVFGYLYAKLLLYCPRLLHFFKKTLRRIKLR